MRYRYNIELETKTDILRFIATMADINTPLALTDGNYKVNPKSMIGVMAALEWNSLTLESEEDIYSQIFNFIKDGSNVY